MEQAAARFFEVERATCFVSGYLGNAVLVQGLRGEYEHTFADKDSHFSIWDATRTVDVPVTPFRHRDPENMATRCRENLKPGERPLVISDGVFSISGEIAPAPDYVQVLESYDGGSCAWTMPTPRA